MLARAERPARAGGRQILLGALARRRLSEPRPRGEARRSPAVCGSLPTFALRAASSAADRDRRHARPAQDFVGPDFVIPSDAGLSSGDVLSFSFGEFGVPEGGSATFVPGAGFTPAPVVVSRVTGGQPSQILGALRSQLGESHFYFLNPWGVFFGAELERRRRGLVPCHDRRRASRRRGPHVLGARADGRAAGREARVVRVPLPCAGPDPARGRDAFDRGATLDLVGGDITLSGASSRRRAVGALRRAGWPGALSRPRIGGPVPVARELRSARSTSSPSRP